MFTASYMTEQNSTFSDFFESCLYREDFFMHAAGGRGWMHGVDGVRRLDSLEFFFIRIADVCVQI